MRAGDAAIAAPSPAEEPIRAELFGSERLERHAESLAAATRSTERPSKGRDLLPRVRENGRELLASYHNIVEAVGEKSEITPAAEWILDNFHVVDEQLREIADHLPRGYYQLLREMYDDALRRLREHRALLDRIAATLLERETLGGGELALLMTV